MKPVAITVTYMLAKESASGGVLFWMPPKEPAGVEPVYSSEWLMWTATPMDALHFTAEDAALLLHILRNRVDGLLIVPHIHGNA